MCQLFETIKIANGEVSNLSYHQQRVAKHSDVELLRYIDNSVAIPIVGIYKLRITYTKSHVCNHSVEPYTPRKINSLKLIIDNQIDYNKKLCNRTCLDNLLVSKGKCDDILIVKNGLVSDTSFANILFFDGKNWITPDSPLLEGSCRGRLIEKNIVKVQRVTVDDLKYFSKFMIINAMLDFDPQRAVKYQFDNNELCNSF